MIDTLHKALALRQRGLVMFAAAEFRRVPGGRTEMIEWLRESDDPARCPEGVLPGPALLVGDPQREAHVGCALGILGTALRRCPAREDAVRCRFGRLGRNPMSLNFEELGLPPAVRLMEINYLVAAKAIIARVHHSETKCDWLYWRAVDEEPRYRVLLPQEPMRTILSYVPDPSGSRLYVLKCS